LESGKNRDNPEFSLRFMHCIFTMTCGYYLHVKAGDGQPGTNTTGHCAKRRQ
jgi:hypothetical protein